MASDKVEITGIVTEVCRGGKFRVKAQLGEKKLDILAYAAGKIRKNMIRIVIGDSVDVELSPYDLTKGRITYRPR